MKRYQKMYDRMRAYWELCAKEVYFIPQSNVTSFVERSTRSSYKYACNCIREGRFTEEQVIACYPL